MLRSCSWGIDAKTTRIQRSRVERRIMGIFEGKKASTTEYFDSLSPRPNYSTSFCLDWYPPSVTLQENGVSIVITNLSFTTSSVNLFFERERIVGPHGRTFSTFSPQGIGNTVWSFARQAQLSLDVIDTLGLGNVKVGTTGRLAVYETSCLDIGEDLIKLLFLKAAEAGIDMGLDRFKTQGEFFCTLTKF